MAARKARRTERDVLVDLLGEEMAERALRLFQNYIQSAEESQVRQAEYEALRAAAPPVDGLAAGAAAIGMLDNFDPLTGMQARLTQELFVTCISQGASPDMAWTRASEGAAFFVGKVRESGLLV